MLEPRKLIVYSRALSLLDAIDAAVELLPPGRAHLKDQLDRATTSIVLNIAEGAGEFSPADKKRFYRMARRSTTEVAAIIDIFERRNVLQQGTIDHINAKLVEVISMLTVLAN